MPVYFRDRVQCFTIYLYLAFSLLKSRHPNTGPIAPSLKSRCLFHFTKRTVAREHRA